jgi:MFS family permease
MPRWSGQRSCCQWNCRWYWGYSPLGSGAALLPLTAIMLVLSARSGRLASRIGPRLQMSVGPVVTGAGFALLTLAAHGSSYVIDVLPAVTVFGLGLAITVAPLTATAMNSAPAEQAGIASAVNNDVARLGGLLAVAVLPALSGITGTAYLHPHALVAGFHTAVLIAAALCAPPPGWSPRSPSPTSLERHLRPHRPRRNTRIAASRRHH